jgi:hypothetical protein
MACIVLTTCVLRPAVRSNVLLNSTLVSVLNTQRHQWRKFMGLIVLLRSLLLEWTDK